MKHIPAFFALPTLADWQRAALPFALFTCIAVPFGLFSGLFIWQPTGAGLWQAALIAFFVPALFEELIFRAPLLWFRQLSPTCKPAVWPATPVFWPATVALGLFVLWHPLNGWLFLPEAKALFLDPRFLFVAFGLGLTCTLVTLETGKLWPAITIHWLVVVGWKGLLGGPQFLTV